MIFITVGTHEQPFDRLVEYMDMQRGGRAINEKVVIQTGYSIYEPRYCEWSRWLPYQEMARNVEEARIVVTHGGPSSFMMPLRIGKIPIVVPRQKRFGEHVNDHQLEFCRTVAERRRNIIVVEDIMELIDRIICYEGTVEGMRDGMVSNNASFNERFGEIVNGMFDGRT